MIGDYVRVRIELDHVRQSMQVAVAAHMDELKAGIAQQVDEAFRNFDVAAWVARELEPLIKQELRSVLKARVQHQLDLITIPPHIDDQLEAFVARILRS